MDLEMETMDTFLDGYFSSHHYMEDDKRRQEITKYVTLRRKLLGVCRERMHRDH